ncbi:MAG: hypothetical protein ABSE40_17280 [Candidatus Sulfotelmatobacter sp.]
MMPTLEIPETLFRRLQRLAIPLVDTHTTVLERVLDDYESRRGNDSDAKPERPQAPEAGPATLVFSPDAPPDLRHASVLRARFAGKTASGWNKLVHEAHIEAMSRLGSLDALRTVTKSNFITGRASSEETRKGYRHVPEIDLSVQNVDAAHAWSNTLRLARHLRVDVSVDFEWMQKGDAAHPGKKGRLAWSPT